MHRALGPVLPHIGTVNAARDLDVMRDALGDGKLNYLGFSYGSRLGAVYAAQFPDKVAGWCWTASTRSPSRCRAGRGERTGQQTALENFLACVHAGHRLPVRAESAGGQGARRPGGRVARREPGATDFGETFSGQDFAGALAQGLYSRELWPSLQRAVAQLLEDGDTSRLEAFASGGVALPPWGAARGGLVDPEDVPLDNLQAALMAVNCADDPDRPAASRCAGSSAGCAPGTSRRRRSSAGTG
ncbi:alpha/beta fold hydrolase [Streptomyces coeruleorubidus]|uniref:alpha/beta fold hydrolase n=1 Tax=Streptomyces coeruleorubidus TaxID=116188 RepID=UPI00315915A0